MLKNKYRTLEKASEYLEMDESELLSKIEKGIISAKRKASYWMIREDTLYELKQHILLWKSGDWKTFYERSADFYTSPIEIDGWIVEDMPEPKAIMKEINEDISKKLKLTKTEKLLEVGCGAGLQAILGLKDKVSEYVGCDYSYSMIRKAKGFLKDTPFIVAEATELPFETDSFDRILCYSVFGYFSDFTYAKKAVSEFIRVCKPGGLILIADIPSSERDDCKGGNRRYIFKRFHFYKWLFYQTVFTIRGRIGLKKNNRDKFSKEFTHLRELFYSHDFFLQFQKTHGCTVEILKVPHPIVHSHKRYTFEARIQKFG